MAYHRTVGQRLCRGELPDGFGMGTLGQIYELLASGAIDVDTFETMMKDAIAGIAK